METASSLARGFLALGRWVDHLSSDLGGGPRHLKLAWVINFQKFGTAFLVFGLMWFYDRYTPAAWTYLALHGTYGMVWLVKDVTMPDQNWQRKVTYGGAMAAFLGVLGPYWVAPWLLISETLPVAPASMANLAAATSVCIFGCVLMMASDAQKYFTLRVKRGLITDGFFRRVRHPNYLGEMMIYGSFAGVVGHWIPWAILAYVWLAIFGSNIARKESSMARYPQWSAYVARTGLLLPRLLPAKDAASRPVNSANSAV